MRLIDADELIDHVYRERLDSRELIAQMVESAPTICDKCGQAIDCDWMEGESDGKEETQKPIPDQETYKPGETCQ